MKCKIIEVTPIKKNISWEKSQVLISGTDNQFIIISTGGQYKDRFEGYCLPCKQYPNGMYGGFWEKSEFQLSTDKLVIEIKND